MQPDQDPPVLIVGAGPVGLTTACMLKLHQIPCLVIEKAEHPHTFSKAFALHSRTLEIFRRLGIADRILAAGKKITEANFFSGDKKFMCTPFADMDTHYPFVLALPQSRIERILEERLIELDGAVARGIALTAVASDEKEVVATLRKGDEQREVIASYLVAADGGRSTTRQLLKVPFRGKSYRNAFIVVDAKVTWHQLAEQANTYLSDKGYLMLTPFPEKGFYRIVLGCPAHRGSAIPTLEEVNRLKDAYGFQALSITDPIWISKTNVQRRLVRHYRYGRVFFAGDAAHVNSPVGGQGMNLGIQDADNIAWKLAYVLKQWAEPSLLDSYHAERYPIARQVLQRTGLMNNLLTLKNGLLRRLRDTMYTRLAQRRSFGIKLARMGAGLDDHYRNSPLTYAHRDTGKPHAPHRLRPGDRAPVLTTEDKAKDALLSDPARYLLLLFSGKKEKNLDIFEDAIAPISGDRLPINAIKLLNETEKHLPTKIPVVIDRDFRFHNQFGVSQTSIYLVRPDGFIVSYYDEERLPTLSTHLNKLFVKPAPLEKAVPL